MSRTESAGIRHLDDAHHLCWSCKEEVGEGPFCGHCVKIQPVKWLGTYYDLFDLTPTYHVDGEALKKRFYELSRKFHPDYYSGHGDDEQHIARDNTAYLNQALATLTDPIRRADYLMSLTVGNVTSNPTPPQQLFDDILEAGELLMNDELSAMERQQLHDVRDRFAASQTALLASLGDRFERLLAGDSDRRTDIESRLDNIKYLRTILGRIERRLETE